MLYSVSLIIAMKANERTVLMDEAKKICDLLSLQWEGSK
jgi:hypothetical protein